MTKIELIPVRCTHAGQWTEYTVRYNKIPNHGHLFFPSAVPVSLLKDVLEDMVNSTFPASPESEDSLNG